MTEYVGCFEREARELQLELTNVGSATTATTKGHCRSGQSR